jgi:uncharacterized protein (DUF983 family)
MDHSGFGQRRRAGRGLDNLQTPPPRASVAASAVLELELPRAMAKFGAFRKVEPHMSLSTIQPDDRPLAPALMHGWRRRCPCCGEGALMQGFLRVRDACPACGEPLHHHRADDGPAYLTVLIVAKLAMAFYMAVFLTFGFEPWMMILLTWSVALGLVFYLLPRFKGAIVAFQWAQRMHGFETDGEGVARRGG